MDLCPVSINFSAGGNEWGGRQPRLCGEINSEWTSSYGGICSGIMLWFDTMQTETWMTQWDQCSALRGQLWEGSAGHMIHQWNATWKLNSTLESTGLGDWRTTNSDCVTVTCRYCSLMCVRWPIRDGECRVSGAKKMMEQKDHIKKGESPT